MSNKDQNALQVTCPVCKAKSGHPCKRPRSRKGPHAERVSLAKQEKVI